MPNDDALGPEGSYYEAKAREEAQKRRKEKDAAYPLLMTVLYLFLGFCFDAWHPGWLVFLTIPLRYMHAQSWKARLTNPAFITLVYLVLGCVFHLWHPGWLVFLLIPLAGSLGWYNKL